MKLEGVSVGVLVADEFEDDELTRPVTALESEGADAVIIGADEHSKLGIVGKRGTVVGADVAVEEVEADDFAALLIPGGHSPDHLAEYPSVLELVHTAAEAQKPIAAICHGPRLLVAAGVAEGRIMAGHRSVEPDIEAAEGVYVDQPVAIDGQFITARGPDDLPGFIDTLLRMLERGARRAA